MWIAEDEVNGEPCIDLSSFPFLSKIALFTLSWVKHEAIESGDDQEFFTGWFSFLRTNLESRMVCIFESDRDVLDANRSIFD